ncbi:hypothetical protein [Pseudoxanthomonas mexicana]|uniref:hypothetical protein n=1 Tax=Pseudoxanthomonas mexicana TaxID=128785 RepID=UPI00398B6E21
MQGLDWVGWLASAILLATLLRQIRTQWKSPSPEGVSRWLFAGQIAASVGFVIYSLSLRNWVFVVTNGLILLTAIAGQIVQHLRRGEGGD